MPQLTHQTVTKQKNNFQNMYHGNTQIDINYMYCKFS
jgi:hypothetical protein